MDHDTLKFLTDEQKARYAPLERLFQSEGWALVEKWASDQRAIAEHRQLNANNWDQYNVHKGAKSAFTLLANLKDETEAEFVALAAANQEAETASDETEFE